LEHIRPWLPFAKDEPQTLEQKVELIRHFRGNFDRDKDYTMGIFDAADKLCLGGCGLHTRIGKGALEIGYWIRASHINQGLATEMAAALTRAAFDFHGVDRVEIHCDPLNERSAAVPRKLGYLHEATLKNRAKDSEGNPRDTMIWTMFRSMYEESTLAKIEMAAFDVAGKII
ncbi:MAG: GNAT family N-acetyltransferase, partial [Anaerolineae bacterium]